MTTIPARQVKPLACNSAAGQKAERDLSELFADVIARLAREGRVVPGVTTTTEEVA